MSLALVIPPRERDLGEGMRVRRALPYVHKRLVGPFIFWDHMGPIAISEHFEMTVRAHPHIGLSTLTYLFSGEILHRDTLGNELPIRAGEVNWMTAGRGIAHSERASLKLGQAGQTLEGIQLWIALPTSAEEVEPSFVHFDATDIPCLRRDGISWRVIAGEYGGVKSPVPVHSPLFYFEAAVATQRQVSLPMASTHEGALYVASGEVEIAGNRYGEGHLLVFAVGSPLEFRTSQDSRLLVLGGEPFPEPRHIWWNFVSSSKERIEQAKTDWMAQRMGKVVGERAEDWIPLPQN